VTGLRTGRSSTAHVQLVHASQAVTWGDARRVTRALERQVRDHFGPAFGVTADVELVPRGREDPAAWQIAIVDSVSSAGDDGWHELTASGLPLGKVYAKQVIAETGGWSSSASHELLEMLADPDMSLTVVAWDKRGSHLYAYEVCDPVQDDRHGYEIGGVLVSDFVLPSWFESFHRARSVRFDQAGACARALQVLPGGYAQVTHTDWVRGWRDVGPSRGRKGKARGSRQGRRRTAHNHWRPSEGQRIGPTPRPSPSAATGAR
jgi:hypothetical protein